MLMFNDLQADYSFSSSNVRQDAFPEQWLLPAMHPGTTPRISELWPGFCHGKSLVLLPNWKNFAICTELSWSLGCSQFKTQCAKSEVFGFLLL